MANVEYKNAISELLTLKRSTNSFNIYAEPSSTMMEYSELLKCNWEYVKNRITKRIANCQGQALIKIERKRTVKPKVSRYFISIINHAKNNIKQTTCSERPPKGITETQTETGTQIIITGRTEKGIISRNRHTIALKCENKEKLEEIERLLNGVPIEYMDENLDCVYAKSAIIVGPYLTKSVMYLVDDGVSIYTYDDENSAKALNEAGISAVNIDNSNIFTSGLLNVDYNEIPTVGIHLENKLLQEKLYACPHTFNEIDIANSKEECVSAIYTDDKNYNEKLKIDALEDEIVIAIKFGEALLTKSQTSLNQSEINEINRLCNSLENDMLNNKAWKSQIHKIINITGIKAQRVTDALKILQTEGSAREEVRIQAINIIKTINNNNQNNIAPTK